MALQTHDAIKSINEFKKRWKIKRNATKFQIIAAAKLSPLPITINNTDTSFILQGNYISQIRPIMEYPPVPLNTVKKPHA